MATKTGYITADGTTTIDERMTNPTFQLTGASWGSGTVVVKANGVTIAGASYTAATAAPVQFLADRLVQISFVMSGSTNPNVAFAVW